MSVTGRGLLNNVRCAVSTDRRTSNVVVNSIGSALLKGTSMCCSLVVVPLTINYLSAEVYGLWMAISSILYWIAFMDIGLGNGMRNHISRAFALGDMGAVRSYFSTAIFYLGFLAVAMGLFFIPLIGHIDLKSLLNSRQLDSEQLVSVMSVAVCLTLVQFVVKNIGLVYVAMQKYAVNDFILFVSNLLTLLSIFILTKTVEPNLCYIVVAFTATPIVVYLLSAIPLLRRHPELSPSISSINNHAAMNIIGKGLGFFVIQIASCIAIFGSANIFISHFFGPEHVTAYNVAYKYFNLLIVGYSVILAPLWNAYTEAYAKHDCLWIKRTYLRSLKFWGLVSALGVIMLAVSPLFFRFWVGSSVEIPWELSVAVFAYVSFFNFANASAHLLNGLSILRVHIITSIVIALLYLLSVIVLEKWLSPVGIIVLMAFSYFIMGIIYAYQCKLVIEQRASGVWSK